MHTRKNSYIYIRLCKCTSSHTLCFANCFSSHIAIEAYESTSRLDSVGGGDILHHVGVVLVHDARVVRRQEGGRGRGRVTAAHDRGRYSVLAPAEGRWLRRAVLGRRGRGVRGGRVGRRGALVGGAHRRP